MNCNDFEATVTDLARGGHDRAARDRALAHAAACRRCAARWQDEQRLTAGLRGLAATFAEARMPARREAQLLAAFRAARRAAPAPGRQRRRAAWAAAAVAVIALILLAALRLAERQEPPVGARSPQAPPPQSTPAPSDQATSPPAPELARPQAPRRQVADAPGRRRRQRVAPSQMAGARAPVADPAAAEGDERADEIATSFIPLAEGRGLGPANSLQLVRVELPRSALVSFGLPMNVERLDQRIKADVLVGNDGVARAIRFVR